MGESAAQLAQTPQHLRDPRTKTSSSGGVETAQAVYVAEGRAKEVTQPLGSTQKIVSGSQIWDIELFTLLEFSFAFL